MTHQSQRAHRQAPLDIVKSLVSAALIALGAWSSTLLLPRLAVSAPSCPREIVAPAPARRLGYCYHTFHSVFGTASAVGRANVVKSNWYVWNFFSHRSNPAAISVNDGGSITLQGDHTGPNGELSTVMLTPASPGFVGVAFGGGGYFEAVLRFDPTKVELKKGWPSFWSIPIERLIKAPSLQWVGQPAGYEHFIEADFFEFDTGQPNAFGGSLHDWYGKEGKTCLPSFCGSHMTYRDSSRLLPPQTNLNQFHRYGFLWVPARNGETGYAEFYFDGQALGRRVSWARMTDEGPPPDGRQWKFSILDQQHLALVLGTGVGEPMSVQSVEVWQTSASKNISH